MRCASWHAMIRAKCRWWEWSACLAKKSQDPAYAGGRHVFLFDTSSTDRLDFDARTFHGRSRRNACGATVCRVGCGCTAAGGLACHARRHHFKSRSLHPSGQGARVRRHRDHADNKSTRGPHAQCGAYHAHRRRVRTAALPHRATQSRCALEGATLDDDQPRPNFLIPWHRADKEKEISTKQLF